MAQKCTYQIEYKIESSTRCPFAIEEGPGSYKRPVSAGDRQVQHNLKRHLIKLGHINIIEEMLQDRDCVRKRATKIE